MLIDRLIEATKMRKSPIIVGLDPVYDKLPAEIRNRFPHNESEAFATFCIDVIDAVEGVCCIVKPQLAYFEALGSNGFAAYEEVVRYAKNKGMFVIADAKRGDIGSTSAAYAKAFFSHPTASADFLTVNPYLGSDCLSEFVKYVDASDKGVFILVKTSNPSSKELQDLKLESGNLVYQQMADMVEEMSQNRLGKYGYSNIGAVVGATHPEQLLELRKRMPSVPFLVPGYGAQGGTAEDVKKAFDAQMLGAWVNSSRGIIFAQEEGQTYRDAIRNAAMRMAKDIRSALEQPAQS